MIENKTLNGILLSLMVLAILVLPAYAAANSMAQNATGNQTSANASMNKAVVDISAKNLAFNTSTITVPAGSQVTINFDNQDNGVAHNVAVYTDSSAKTSIYVGKIINGIAKTTYTFTAPSKPGTYFFRCDVHPTTMKGQFIVK